MNTEEAPFYLAINHCKNDSSSKLWFKKSALGVNTLNSLMKRMAQKAGLGSNITNHSGRKTMVQTLTNNAVPPTDIIQLSGHKNVQSVTNYSNVSSKQQMQMSRTLTGLASGKRFSGGSYSNFKQDASTEVYRHQGKHNETNPDSAATCQQQQQQAMSLFSGATVHGCHIQVSINSLNQSPVATTSQTSPPKYKRLKILEDSDSDN